MSAHVVVITKGRPVACARLLERLRQQSMPAAGVIFVGTSREDLGPLYAFERALEGWLTLRLSDVASTTTQRNRGVDAVNHGLHDQDDFIVFFDDDFRPAADWLEQCAAVFAAQPKVVGVTGQVLADGATIGGVSEEDGSKYLSGELPPMSHWCSGPTPREVESAYGCNMAFRAGIFRSCRFDEALPLYAWQEDRDFSAQARRLGPVVYAPGPRGVHLAVRQGRISGAQFGYSQIANVCYLHRKGTATLGALGYLIGRALLSNIVHSPARSRHTDYRGRLLGNAKAIADLVLGRCRQDRVCEIM